MNKIWAHHSYHEFWLETSCYHRGYQLTNLDALVEASVSYNPKKNYTRVFQKTASKIPGLCQGFNRPLCNAWMVCCIICDYASENACREQRAIHVAAERVPANHHSRSTLIECWPTETGLAGLFLRQPLSPLSLSFSIQVSFLSIIG